MSAQKNTLFKYFNSSPAPKNVSEVADKSKHNPPSKDKAKSAIISSKQKVKKDIGFQVYDIVWVKIDGYPWWPAFISNDPKSKTYTRKKEFHVQFFDEPPSRAWVSHKNIETFKNISDKPVPSKGKDKWSRCCQKAEEALAMDAEQRSKLVVDFTNGRQDSDDDDDDDTINESTRDLDDSVHDADKENMNKDSGPPKKRLRLSDLDSDSEDDYQPSKDELNDETESESSGILSEHLESDEEPELGSDEEDNKGSGKKRKRTTDQNSSKKKKISLTPSTPRTPKTPLSGKNSTKVKLACFSAKDNVGNESLAEGEVSMDNNFSHLKLDFLKEDKIKDAAGKRPSDPDYNPRTLYVPQSYKNTLTPALKQWWDMKAQNFDCVLFFKVGKFYELYHMDAVTGVNELNLMYMKGEHAHSGFPEIAYGRFASALVSKGYKVARVEQTENPEMMAERCKKTGKNSKFDKVVKRELCQITTPGTRVFGIIDGEAKEAESNYLVAIAEKVSEDKFTFGVCFIDTSIGIFHMGQFDDDRHCSRLRTLIAHHPPIQILYERGRLSEKTLQILNSCLATVIKETLAPESEFWTAHKTLVTLAEGNYFTSDSGVAWPEELQHFISDSSALGLCAKEDGELAVSALGACTWYLKRCHLEQQLLAMKRFSVYKPVDMKDNDSDIDTNPVVKFGKHMILDGITLHNLNILDNSVGELEGTLLGKLDQCCTPFGKRLLRQWICSPLCDIESIVTRQQALQYLMERREAIQQAREKLVQLPDLERLLSRIHAEGNAVRSETHPDSRAIFYEDQTYSKKKIVDFTSTLTGFKLADEIATELRAEILESSSSLLQRIIYHPPTGTFPEMAKTLTYFETAFDREEALKQGCIIPSKGVDAEYDAVIEELQEIKKDLNDYLNEQCKYFGCKVTYFGSDKKRFQLEVPDGCSKKADSGYELQSQRKGYKRFWTKRTKELLSRQMAAEEQKKSLLKDLSRRIFSQFSDRYDQWNTVVQCIAVLDILTTLAEYCLNEGQTCVPKFVHPSKDSKPYINIMDGRHPFLAHKEDFISNNTFIGCNSWSSLLLVTGPNMGGKSTLMRQVALLVIMAQMGCYIPAVSCELTPVDRIFTRLGANDDIMAGESTFFVELSETSAIMQHATKHSLILIDELGRGTSTYDGTAIASAVLHELVRLDCRTLFSTHYHSLVEDFKSSPTVSLGHMACMVENETDNPSEETVIFLYKFVEGACPKSYGFNAARLAGIPSTVTKRAYEKASTMEIENNVRKVFLDLLNMKSVNTKQLVDMLKRVSL